MPAASAASTSPVHFGTEISTSSTVSVTSSALTTIASIAAMHPRRRPRRELSNQTRPVGCSRRHLGDGMVRVCVARRHDAFERRLAVEGTAALLDVRDELGAPVLHEARNGIHGEVAERAQRLAEDAVADGAKQIDVGQLAVA